MNKTLKLIDEKTLYLYDSDNNIIAQYKPRWTKFDDVKRAKKDCNIIKENDEAFRNKDNYNFKGNIYCLDDAFKIKWTIDTSFENDSFPYLVWNKQTSLRKGENGYMTLDITDNPDTFICVSWSGMTMTVKYESGQIIDKVLTK